MNNKLIKGISSCALAAMLLSTGAAAQVTTQDGTAAVSTENISFSDCVEKIRSVYTERYPEQVEVVNSVIDDITSDSIFWECYEYEGKTAFRILEDTLMDALTPTVETYNYDGKVAWTSYTIPVITQMNDYYCGPASVQMALFGCGKSSPEYDYPKSDAFQASLGSALNTNQVDGTNISKITAYMKKYYTTGTYTYKTKAFTTNTYNKVISYLSLALQSNTTPILRVSDKSTFKYYNNLNKKSHYVVVKKIDTVNRIITVVDPHYDSRFNGEQTITYDELYKNANNDSDIWISVYTYGSDDPYEYNF